MDHQEALRLHAATQYVLGELSEADREAYEEHFCDCFECGRDVQAAEQFVLASREVFRTESSKFVPKPAVVRSGWFAWCRPAFAFPALAALALMGAVIAYQNLVTIPAARHASAGATAQLFQSSFRIQGSTRGDSLSKVTVVPGESFALDFDFTPTEVLPHYSGQLLDEQGNALLSFPATGDQANREVHLVVPGSLVHPGKYQLVFSGAPVTPGSNGREAQRIVFVVDFR